MNAPFTAHAAKPLPGSIADPERDFARPFGDSRILRPCRFCGEREHLHVDEGAFERVQVVDGQVIEITWKGHTAEGAEYVDAVNCQVCDTIAALDVWNGTRSASDYAALRDFEPAARVQAVAA